MTFAFTVTDIRVFGSMKVRIGTFTATSVTSGDITTGLGVVKHATINNITATRAGQICDTTTTPGTLKLSGLTSGDTGTWIAFGK